MSDYFDVDANQYAEGGGLGDKGCIYALKYFELYGETPVSKVRCKRNCPFPFCMDELQPSERIAFLKSPFSFTQYYNNKGELCLTKIK